MRRLVISGIIVLFFLPTFADVCAPGNFEVLPIDCFDDPGSCDQEEILCCVEVGDGSAISCTDGQTWRCFGNCAE